MEPNTSPILSLEGYCDANWASDIDDPWSRSGFCMFLGRNLISRQSRKQHVMSRSSTEAEYRSLAHLTDEITWITSQLIELKYPLLTIPTVWYDNLSTVLLSANPIQHARRKHVELDLYFVREKVVQGRLIVKHIPLVDQIADILTESHLKLKVQSPMQQTRSEIFIHPEFEGGC